MFWRLSAFSASSPVESILDKEDFTLEELLDEEEIIQECRALNSRLINFLRDGAQVEQLLRYIVEEPSEDAESKRAFKFPFVACEIFTCEIDVIFKTLVEDEELLKLLFSFLEANRPHSALLAGYFSKVVTCLMLRKTVPLMNYVQAHQDIFRQLVDLIGITSIMEVLVRLVGADDHMYPNFMDVVQWLADSDLLEMIVDKLSPFNPPEVHANAAETLCSITRNALSALFVKISSSSFVARIFAHALENSPSKSTLVHSLSVFISLLDPRRSASGHLVHYIRSQHLYEPSLPVNPETLSAMLPKLGDLLGLLNVSSSENVLPTTYGELRPPLGKHRLKIVEFFSVLLKTGNEAAERELISLGAIQRILDLFFEYPYNNLLHHHVETTIVSCLESKSATIVDHLFRDCNLVGKILQADSHPILSGESNLPTVPAAGKKSPRSGNLGHLTRIANKLVQVGNVSDHIRAYLQESAEWVNWHTGILHERNNVGNIYRWACGRPTVFHERTRDSDDDELQDTDYDVAELANNLTQAFRCDIYENEGAEEVHGLREQDHEDAYFDDESAEVVISSLRLGDDQESCLFTNSNWFTFQESRTGNESVSTSSLEQMDEISLNDTATVSNGGSSSDDEVVIGDDGELMDNATSINGTSGLVNDLIDKTNTKTALANGELLYSGRAESSELEKPCSSDDPCVRCDTTDNGDHFRDQPLPDWVTWRESSHFQVDESGGNPFDDNVKLDIDHCSPLEAMGSKMDSCSNDEIEAPNGLPTILDSKLVETSISHQTVPSLFEEDVEFVGVELEGTKKAMEQALNEGIVGEASPMKRCIIAKFPEKDKCEGDVTAILEFNDINYWQVDKEVGLVQE